MNTKLKTQNANIAKAMQAKSANGKQNVVKTNTVKPATPKPQTPVTLTKKTTTPKAPRKTALKATETKTPATPQANETKPVVEPKPAPKPELNTNDTRHVEPKPALSTDKPATKATESKPLQKFVMRAGNLKAALKAVDRARGKNASLPILTHTLIETLDGAVRFTATDLNFTLWHLAQANILHAGRVAVPDLLTDVLAKVNDDVMVTLTTDAKTHKLGVQAGRVSLSINAYDANEFPHAAAFNGKSIVIGAEITHEGVNEIVKRVAPFVSTDDARPVLTGILVSGILPAQSGGNATLTFASADGFRLSVLERDATLHFDPDRKMETFSAIVPARVFIETLKIATDTGKPIQFLFHLQFDAKGALEHGMVQIETHAGGMRMNLLDGNFPDFTKIVPNPIPDLPYLPLGADETIAALGRAALFNETQNARLTALPQVNLVMISAHGSDVGDFVETLPATFDADRTPTDRFEIAFNAGYLMDALRATTYKDGDKPVALRVSAPSSPAFISIPRFRHVIMPMHVNASDKPAPKPETPKAEPPKADPKPQNTAKEETKAETPKAAAKSNGHTKSKDVTPARPNTAKPFATNKKKVN